MLSAPLQSPHLHDDELDPWADNPDPPTASAPATRASPPPSTDSAAPEWINADHSSLTVLETRRTLIGARQRAQDGAGTASQPGPPAVLVDSGPTTSSTLPSLSASPPRPSLPSRPSTRSPIPRSASTPITATGAGIASTSTSSSRSTRRRAPTLTRLEPVSPEPMARNASHPLALNRLDPLTRNSLDSRSRVAERGHTISKSLANMSLAHTLDPDGGDDVSDISRPALRKLTSDAERHVAETQSQSHYESSWNGSERGGGSLDVRREGSAKEVEVIVHKIQPGESLPGIALRYGIELAVLRKVNKMWPSDPLHLRTHLYVPVEACRPTAKGDKIIRTADGQVLVAPRRTVKGKEGGDGEHEGIREAPSGNGLGSHDDYVPDSDNGEEDGWGFAQGCPGGQDNEHGRPVVVDVVRLPASQLRFFPDTKPRSARASLESSDRHDRQLAKSASSVRALSAADRAERLSRKASIQSAHMARSQSGPTYEESAPLAPLDGISDPLPRQRSKVVRLRPPQAQHPVADGASLASRISGFFSVPPPPTRLDIGRRRSRTLDDLENSALASPNGGWGGGAGSNSQSARDTPPRSPELVEMDARLAGPSPGPSKWQTVGSRPGPNPGLLDSLGLSALTGSLGLSSGGGSSSRSGPPAGPGRVRQGLGVGNSGGNGLGIGSLGGSRTSAPGMRGTGSQRNSGKEYRSFSTAPSARRPVSDKKRD